MEMVQENKVNVCPVLDYHELNKCTDTQTADANVHAQEWWQKGYIVSILNLQKSYLQVAVLFKECKYCLTRNV